MVSAAGAIYPIGRIGQGLPAGVEGAEAAVNAATGGKLGMAKTAMNAAAPVAGAIAQGAGLRIGWGIGGIFSFILNALKNLWPEFGTDKGYFGLYIWFIIFVYYWSWLAGFATSAVLSSHTTLAVIGFIFSVKVDGLSFQTVRRYGIVFSVLLLIDIMLLRGTIHWYLLLIAALLLAFKEGNPVKDAQRVILVMAVAGIGYYVYNRGWLPTSLVLPFFAKLNLPLGFDSILFYGAVLLNRTVTYPFLWYGIFGLNNKTRVANFLSWFVMLLLIFANWPLLSPEISKIRNQYASGVTAEQRAVIPNLFVSAVGGVRSLGASLGALISAKTAYAYESAQATFGFGEPKEEPKLGLTLVQDSTMLKKYDINYKKPEPSFIMRITSPFPTDTEKPYMEVTNIRCEDKSAKLKPLLLSGSTSKAVTSKGVTPTEDKPVVVFYNGADGGAQVKCVFDEKDWEPGNTYTIAAEVDYKVDATAFLTTAFIRADQDEALRKKGIDPAVVNKIPPANARYDNVPVTLTWGPPDLTKSPASINVGRPLATDLSELAAAQTAETAQNLLITVYVSKNSGWENSEIKSVNNLTLTVPPGVSLNDVDDSCDFKLKAVDQASRSTINPALDTGLQYGNSIYAVKDDRIRKNGDPKFPRFIGDAIRFECGMKVGSGALSGADWAPARFDITGSFVFTTKLDGITFTVEDFSTAEGSKKALTTPTSTTPSQPAQSATVLCTVGATRDCTTQQICPGSETCSNGAWGDCTDKLNDGCPAATGAEEEVRIAKLCVDAGGVPSVFKSADDKLLSSVCRCASAGTEWDYISTKCVSTQKQV